jgi:hypothetical protein
MHQKEQNNCENQDRHGQLPFSNTAEMMRKESPEVSFVPFINDPGCAFWVIPGLQVT